METSHGWYVFGVTDDATLPAGLNPTPLADAVVGVRLDSIQAIASCVPLDEIAGDAPQDPGWLVPRAEAHDRVLVAMATTRPVVPFRFGVVHGTREGLVHALRAESADLGAALRRIGPCQEWTIHIAPTRAARASSAAGSGRRRGRDYLNSREAELTARERIDDAVAAVLHRCNKWGIATAPMAPAPDGSARMACLLPRAGGADLVAGLRSLIPAHEPFELEVRGPLPPYRFADEGQR